MHSPIESTGLLVAEPTPAGRASVPAAARPVSARAGSVFWITGLSGAGKTTVGRELWSRLRSAGRTAVFLDGDVLRDAISDDLGHSGDDRLRSARRNSRTCRLLADQGLDVVCSTISMFREVRQWNRENIVGYREIYLRVPMHELESRDHKRIYLRARSGKLANVVGIDVPAELPDAADLVLDNYGELDPEKAADLIWERLVAPGGAIAPAGTAPSAAFGTKAETLARLAAKIQNARVLPQICFSVAEWRDDADGVLAKILAASWGSGPLIARSSAKGEDSRTASQAGKYVSIPNVLGAQALTDAVERVIASYLSDSRPDHDQVFVQPFLENVSLSGVAFSRDPNGGGPYIIINYDDTSGRTDLVTSGSGADLKTFVCVKSRSENIPQRLAGIPLLIGELAALLECDALDIEFAVDRDGTLYLLQVRPLVTGPASPLGDAAIDGAIAEIACKVELLSRSQPYLHGTRAVFGVMPDWNPAEMIGLRPRPLALSLYQELVTDAIWAYQRNNYGYKNLRSFPLLASFHGLPYIDARVSFNSFIPRDIDGNLAERLVNYYLDRLRSEPNLHDKVEFEIVFSCYTLDLPERIRTLKAHGFSDGDIEALVEALRLLTNRIMNGPTALWRQDRDKIDVLAARLPGLLKAPIDKISRIYWLIEDCKRYGTLPFAGLARAGFIAVQILRSLAAKGILDEAEYAAFMSSLDTVGSRIGRDFAQLSREAFLERYGHLRPGTYDILSLRYDEAPDLYFDWSSRAKAETPSTRFALSVEQWRNLDRLLKEHAIETDVLGLVEFIKAGIEGREYAKFVFTKSLSEALSLIKQLGEECGLTPEDCAFLDFGAIRKLHKESGPVGARLSDSVAEGRCRYELTRSLVLPPLITSPADVFAFNIPPTQANFVTQKSVTAPVSTLADAPEKFAGSVLLIPSADPGFDWIFSRGISGLVTMFGGVNSHMAIRAGELGLPAVIGSGEQQFRRWQSARLLCIDCANRQVQAVA